jgi:hypothetical protein
MVTMVQVYYVQEIKCAFKFVRALLTNFLIANTTIGILIWKLNKTIKHEKYNWNRNDANR